VPTLPNAKHERFAQELAKGKTADEAYQIAGYSANRGNATTLKAKKSISGRVAEILGRGAARIEVTVESLVREAEEARVAAMELGQVSAAVAAIKEKGVLSGKRIERHEVDKAGAFEALSDDDLAAEIAAKLSEVGIAPAETKH
jgi:hypothetical protein